MFIRGRRRGTLVRVESALSRFGVTSRVKAMRRSLSHGTLGTRSFLPLHVAALSTLLSDDYIVPAEFEHVGTGRLPHVHTAQLCQPASVKLTSTFSNRTEGLGLQFVLCNAAWCGQSISPSWRRSRQSHFAASFFDILSCLFCAE
jgi:hypothetical protein